VNRAPSARTATLEEKRAFLSRADTYGPGASAVQVVETHMSLVFLTDGHAYKLKKPVQYPYLDFRTLEARAHDCREELRLNRRLAKDVYLDVVPLAQTAHGELALGKKGEIVDWLVHMRRLSNERFLDQAILSGEVSDDDVRSVGALLVSFYRSGAPAALDAAAYIARFDAERETNIMALKAHPFGLPLEKLTYVDDAQRGFLDRDKALLVGTVTARQIVEGHGDLRPEHVHLGPPVAIIDCLEFSQWLRLVDPFEELAFLTMECERLGAYAFAEGLLSFCSEGLARPAPPRLLAFYKSSRALLRARLCVMHLVEPAPREPAKWPKLATAYLDLSARAADVFTGKEAP
jgi:uncharacterized protein